MLPDMQVPSCYELAAGASDTSISGMYDLRGQSCLALILSIPCQKAMAWSVWAADTSSLMQVAGMIMVCR